MTPLEYAVQQMQENAPVSPGDVERNANVARAIRAAYREIMQDRTVDAVLQLALALYMLGPTRVLTSVGK